MINIIKITNKHYKRFLDLSNKAWEYFLMSIKVPSDIPYLIWTIFIKKVHIGELLRLYKYKKWLISANIQTVIDIGANTGQFATAIRSILPNVYIYSFEPLYDSYKILTNKMLKKDNFKAFNIALGETNGEKIFYKSNFSESSSVLPMAEIHKKKFPWTAETTKIYVKMQRLDDIKGLVLYPKVLMKIDVQGYELNVLYGAKETLKQIDYIIVETSFFELYKNNPKFDEIYEFLKKCGFKYCGSWDQLLAPDNKLILQQDALFIKI